jgi:hypothetical protein
MEVIIEVLSPLTINSCSHGYPYHFLLDECNIFWQNELMSQLSLNVFIAVPGEEKW